MKKIFFNLIRIILILLILYGGFFTIFGNFAFIKKLMEETSKEVMKNNIKNNINNKVFEIPIAKKIYEKLQKYSTKLNNNSVKYEVLFNKQNKTIVIKSIQLLSDNLWKNVDNGVNTNLTNFISNNFSSKCKDKIWQSYFDNGWKIKYEFYIENEKNKKIKKINEIISNKCYNIENNIIN